MRGFECRLAGEGAIFLLEDLKANTNTFARRICEFIGVNPHPAAALFCNQRHNKRVSQRYLTYSQLRKKLGMYVPLGWLLPLSVRERVNDFIRSGTEASVEMPSGWASHFEEHYREDNRRLAEEWSLPLERYGYPL